MYKYKRKFVQITILTILLVNLLNCGRNVGEYELIGKYRINYSYGVEEISLLKDGTYSQTIRISGKPESRSRTGAWDYRSSDGHVVLHNPMIVDNGFGETKSYFWEQAEDNQGTWALDAKKSIFGKISLRWNDDLGYAFEKIN